MKTEAQIKERQLFLTQVISGLLFSVFLLFHLGNQMFAAWGPTTYDSVQQNLRRGYQAPVVEILLVLLPMMVHAVSGVLRMLHRRKTGRTAPQEIRSRLHRISGILLLIFFLGHTIATRGTSYFYQVFPGFEGLSFTFRWMPFYFWPYYATLALAGLYHLLYGLSMALPVFGWQRASVLRSPKVLWVLFGIAGFFLVMGVLGLGGVLFDVGCPEAGPYAKLLESLGFADLSGVACLR